MDAQIIAALLGFAGGVLSTAIGTATALYVKSAADKALESDEIRRRRVDIIYRLLGARYVLVENYQPSSSEVQAFNTAMAAFSVYFADDKVVTAAYDKFLNKKNDENLAEMLRAAAKIAKLELLDTHLKRVMTVPATFYCVSINPPTVTPSTHLGAS